VGSTAKSTARLCSGWLADPGGSGEWWGLFIGAAAISPGLAR
jgi:hypothetical protein